MDKRRRPRNEDSTGRAENNVEVDAPVEEPLGLIWRLRGHIRPPIEKRLGNNMYIEARARLQYLPDHARSRLHEEQELLAMRRGGVVPFPATDITIVCSTYRRPQKVRRAIESVLAQTTTRTWTMVVVDDAGGLERSDLPDDPRVHLLGLKRNEGSPAVPRNIALRFARSPLVAFLDDDNQWLPDHLELLAEAMEGNDCVFAYSQMVKTMGGEPTDDVFGQPFDREVLREGHFIDTNTLMVRRRPGVRFSTLPRFPQARYWVAQGEDWEITYRLSRHGRPVAYVPKVTVLYEADGDSYWRLSGVQEAGL
jgi:hypothetical protein